VLGIREAETADVFQEFIGTDAGELIYDGSLKRFKFKLTTIEVTSVDETAEQFWFQYKERGNPRITGVWGDPKTNSIVVVGVPEAESAIRNTIAKWEGQATGIDFSDDTAPEGPTGE